MDSSIKSLTITGAAAESIAVKAARRSLAVSRKKRKDQVSEDDDFIEQIKQHNIISKQEITPKQLQIQQPRQSAGLPLPLPSPSPSPLPSPSSSQLPSLSVLPPQPNSLQTSYLQYVPEGLHVILKPPKQQRVKLQPKNYAQPTLEKPILQTRKARRIRLTVGNLTNRFTRAKKLKDDTEQKSSGTIRDFLLQRGVIQEKSKAPEKMLRSMYSDFMLLKDSAL